MSDLFDDSLVFPTDNSLGIPCLKPDLQAKWLEKPCYSWGSVPRGVKNGVKTWHFYTDDYRWNSLKRNPEKLVNTYPETCCELNISLFNDTAPALVVAEIFKKRWVSRYWQENGIHILVDLFVPENHQDYNLLGVPTGWRAYSTRGKSGETSDLESDFNTAKRHAKTDDIFFVVFAGGADVADWCVQNQAIHLPYRVTK